MRLFDFPNVNDSHSDLLGGLQIGPGGDRVCIPQSLVRTTPYIQARAQQFCAPTFAKTKLNGGYDEGLDRV
jgi:hypothetical protein